MSVSGNATEEFLPCVPYFSLDNFVSNKLKAGDTTDYCKDCPYSSDCKYPKGETVTVRIKYTMEVVES